MKAFFAGDVLRMCSLTGTTGQPRCYIVKDVDVMEDQAKISPVQYSGREYGDAWVSFAKLQYAVKIPHILLFSEV